MKSNLVERICEQCGATFLARRDHVARGYARFCGRACFAEFNRGKPFSAERRANLKRAHNRPETRERHRQATIRQLQRLNRGQPLGTALEIKVQEELERRGISFATQKKMLDRYVVDFLLRDWPVVIEADGVHHRLPRSRARDAERDRLLYEAGYIVFRLPGAVIMRNVSEAVERIMRYIQGQIEAGHWDQPKQPFAKELGRQTGPDNPMYGKTPWNKGLTVETSPKWAAAMAKWRVSMEKNGIWQRNKGRWKTPHARWENLKEDYLRLGSAEKVAREYQCGATTVRRHLKMIGIVPPKIRSPQKRRQLIADQMDTLS